MCMVRYPSLDLADEVQLDLEVSQLSTTKGRYGDHPYFAGGRSESITRSRARIAAGASPSAIASATRR
jgi:hypothetical protein